MKKKGAVLRAIAELGQPILRAKTRAITDPRTDAIQSLIRDMIRTLMDTNGVGIASPQVYEPIRLFIVASHPSPRYPNAPKMKPTAVINPTILSVSEEMGKDWEGCLSIPGIRGFVPRHTKIVVEFTTKEGKRVKRVYTDFIARIFQHEFDHLEGTVFLDRVRSARDIITEKEFQRMFQRRGSASR